MNANPRFRPRARWISACLRVALLAFLLVVARVANYQTVTSASLSAANLPALAMNGKIAFTSNRDGNREIYVMNRDGTDQVRLTNNTIVDDHPTWSPDGLKIAFVSERTTGGRAIFTMNPDGTDRTQVTPVSYADLYANWPYLIWTDFYSMDWSPDGRQIVFQDNYDIVIVNADGSNRHAITDNTAYDLEPSWSPDGSKIVFSRDLVNDQLIYGRLCSVNIDGSNIQFLSNGWQFQAYAPKWAPSGDKILYVIEFTDFDPTSVISISNADGSAAQLFDGRTDVYEYQYRNKPSWSPDGMKILFDKLVYETGYPGDLEIYVKNIDGTGFTQLTNTNGWNFNPSWQPLVSAACPNPIDCADFFVHQHYLDFLNREPDPAGLAAWQAVLNGCVPTDTSCDRIHVSSAFFRSPEFQERGYFVYRFYPVTFGRKPDYDEFRPDLAKVSGFLTDAELEAAKQAFITEFMNRPAFVAKFNGLDNTAYVDTLLSTAGITHSGRDFWIAALGNGTRTRAQVLREIAESGEVYQKYFNQAFVVMQYFGYLRRQPDALYLDWIDHLEATGDYRSMINGFVNSAEYRQRFGP